MQHERGIVVAAGILLIHADLHAECVLQIEERLLHVAHHHGDVDDAGFLQLANLALDQHLAAHAQHAFRPLIRKRHKPRRQTRRHDDSVIHLIRLQRLRARFGEDKAFRQTFVVQLLHDGVDGSKGHVRVRSNIALRGNLAIMQRQQHSEFPF